MTPMAFVVLAASILFIVVAIVVLKLHPFLALILAAMLVGLLSPVSLGDGAPQAVLALELTAAGFGQTAAGIGIVIVLAAIIGQCLMDSGAADRIVSALLRWFGERRADVSLMGSGYILSVPVFFDTVFFLLVPIARTLWARTRAHYVVYVMAISGGAVITHSVVPPTPGPLVMTEALGLDLGIAIFGGLLLGLLPAGVALALAHAVDARLTVEPAASVREEEPVRASSAARPRSFPASGSPARGAHHRAQHRRAPGIDGARTPGAGSFPGPRSSATRTSPSCSRPSPRPGCSSVCETSASPT